MYAQQPGLIQIQSYFQHMHMEITIKAAFKDRFGKNVAFKSIFRMRVLIYCCNDIVYCGVHVLVYVQVCVSMCLLQ